MVLTHRTLLSMVAFVICCSFVAPVHADTLCSQMYTISGYGTPSVNTGACSDWATYGYSDTTDGCTPDTANQTTSRAYACKSRTCPVSQTVYQSGTNLYLGATTQIQFAGRPGACSDYVTVSRFLPNGPGTHIYDCCSPESGRSYWVDIGYNNNYLYTDNFNVFFHEGRFYTTSASPLSYQQSLPPQTQYQSIANPNSTPAPSTPSSPASSPSTPSSPSPATPTAQPAAQSSIPPPTPSDPPPCAPGYYCDGNQIFQQFETCATRPLTVCDPPTFCSSGASVCITPSLSVTQHLKAIPSLVRRNGTTKLSWAVTGATNCTVSGNGDSWSGLSGAKLVSSPIIQQTVYTLTCSRIGGGVYTETATVNLVPVWVEM